MTECQETVQRRWFLRVTGEGFSEQVDTALGSGLPETILCWEEMDQLPRPPRSYLLNLHGPITQAPRQWKHSASQLTQ